MSRWGFLGLWSVASACSGSTSYLNRQQISTDGGGNTSAGGSLGDGGGSQSGGNGSGSGGAVDVDASAGGSTATGGTVGAGGIVGVGAGGTGGSDPFATGGAPTGVTASTKLDLLLMVDNSSSMADKQAPLARTIADLIQGVAGVRDLHVGVVTSSLGSHGTTACEGREDLNDHAHLLGTRPRGVSLNLPKGFIEWTPAQGTTALQSQVQAMVQVAGQVGCGLESQLEAVYRFLSDPYPPQDIVLQPCLGGGAQCAFPQGIDSELLAERAAFLRPDSAVAVVLLTDENDCSIRDSDQYYYAAELDVFLPAASTVCATNPNDPCCYSCGLATPPGCPADPACGPPTPNLNNSTDPPNLRCFDERRRFGIDFLYPVQRYVNALKSRTLCTTVPDLAPVASCPARPDQSPGLVANPLYQNASGGQARDPSLVYVLGILGVPWQDLTADTSSAELHYLAPKDLASAGAWAKILGNSNPGAGAPPVPPTDPHMQESIYPRAGIPGPSAGLMADPINGHEWNISRRDDLEYACIFPLPEPPTCDSAADCDCFQRPASDANPLCQSAAGYDDVQRYAKAYPGLRELSVVKALGPNGIPASICPRNLTDSGAQDYGYRPAVEALANGLAGVVK